MNQPYFLYDPAGDEWRWFATEEECLQAAAAMIELYAADGEWNEEVEQLVCGRVTHRATQIDRKDRPPAEELVEGEDADGFFWPDNGADYACDYAMRPLEETQP